MDAEVDEKSVDLSSLSRDSADFCHFGATAARENQDDVLLIDMQPGLTRSCPCCLTWAHALVISAFSVCFFMPYACCLFKKCACLLVSLFALSSFTSDVV